MVKKVSEHLIDYLHFAGIDTFFLVTGGAIVPTVDYLGRKEGVKYYCFQHEQSAAIAAEGYYRASGKVAAVLATSGPGAQNLLNGICGCWYESVPAIFITGQVSTYESISAATTSPRQVGFQEMPVVESFKHFTKYSKLVTNAESFMQHLTLALEQATSGRKGPVLLDLPVDIQNSVVEVSEYVLPTEPTVEDNLEGVIILINQCLATSTRPLVLLGHGVRLAGAVDEARKLIETLNIPFALSWGGFDLIEHSHKQFVGTVGVYGSRGGNFAIQNCDMLITIGSRLDTRQTGGDIKSFSRGSYKVMVDIDAEELFKGRGLQINLPVKADAKNFIQTWLNNVPVLNLNDEWIYYITKYQNVKVDRPAPPVGFLSSYSFLEELQESLPDDAIIIPDEGGNLVWSMQSFKPKRNQRVFSNFGNSSMGYALPAAIGAAIGSGKDVYVIDGDGGFQMNIQELQTIKQYKLPVRIFILNNNCYGIIKQFQDAYFDSRYTATDEGDYTAPDFAAVAQAYGITGLRADINNRSDMINVGVKGFSPVLIDVIIDKGQKLTPKLEFGNPLEDMSPYISDEELQGHMIVDMLPRRDNTQGWVTLNK
jgi:acetolactate synthase I/II/III large subunit